MKQLFINRQARILMLGFALLLLLSSCKKDDNGVSGYLIQFKANGKQVEFTEQASLLTLFYSGSVYNALFSGYTASSNISLQVFDNKTISETTYSGYALVGSAFVGALIDYQDTDGTIYTQGTANSDASVTITQLAATTVRGTFSATLKASGKPDMVISQGQFFVRGAN